MITRPSHYEKGQVAPEYSNDEECEISFVLAAPTLWGGAQIISTSSKRPFPEKSSTLVGS